MFIYKLIITVSFLLAAVMASAQQKKAWTLRECIDYALENNITVKQQDVKRRQGEIDLSTAKNSRLPDLSASASQNWSFGRGLTSDNTYSNQNTGSTSFSLGTSVPLFTGFSIPRTIELNKLNLEALTADLAKARDDVSVQVAQAYVQILYGMELRDVAQRQIAIDSMQVERLSEMYRTGKASGVEVAQQKATLAQSRLTYTQADNDYRLALLSLAQLLELSTPEGFVIVRPDAAALTVGGGAGMPLPDEIYQEAVAVKPEVKAEAYRLKGAEMNLQSRNIFLADAAIITENPRYRVDREAGCLCNGLQSGSHGLMLTLIHPYATKNRGKSIYFFAKYKINVNPIADRILHSQRRSDAFISDSRPAGPVIEASSNIPP